MLEEIHERDYGLNVGGRVLTRKVLRVGFHWPMLLRDTPGHLRKCDKYQFY